jgi:hypothetical protein
MWRTVAIIPQPDRRLKEMRHHRAFWAACCGGPELPQSAPQAEDHDRRVLVIARQIDNDRNSVGRAANGRRLALTTTHS